MPAVAKITHQEVLLALKNVGACEGLRNQFVRRVKTMGFKRAYESLIKRVGGRYEKYIKFVNSPDFFTKHMSEYTTIGKHQWALYDIATIIARIINQAGIKRPDTYNPGNVKSILKHFPPATMEKLLKKLATDKNLVRRWW
jgi:uncharacterized protein YutE (UPF0331/DUF86 family)